MNRESKKWANSVVWPILFIILGLFILGIQKFTPQLDSVMTELEHSELSDDMALHEILLSKDSNIYIDGLFVCMGCLISLIGLLAWFPFYSVYTRQYKNKNNSLKRTEKGEHDLRL